MIIYLAGPIRPKNGQTLRGNVEAAKTVALELWRGGYAVICPHANTDLPTELADKECEQSVWLNGDLEMVTRCDAMVVLPGWEASAGTKGEIQYAEARKIPVHYYPDLPPISTTEQLRPQQVHGFIDILMSMYRVHLQKNADYSPANILGTGEIGLMTRVWDKVARLMNLFGFKIEITSSCFEHPSAPKCEAIEDTILDLAVYAVIWQLLRRSEWGK